MYAKIYLENVASLADIEGEGDRRALFHGTNVDFLVIAGPEAEGDQALGPFNTASLDSVIRETKLHVYISAIWNDFTRHRKEIESAYAVAAPEVTLVIYSAWD